MAAISLAASGVGGANGSTPLPHRYIRPGFAGSFIRLPSRRSASTTLMNSSRRRAPRRRPRPLGRTARRPAGRGSWRPRAPGRPPPPRSRLRPPSVRKAEKLGGHVDVGVRQRPPAAVPRPSSTRRRSSTRIDRSLSLVLSIRAGGGGGRGGLWRMEASAYDCLRLVATVRILRHPGPRLKGSAEGPNAALADGRPPRRSCRSPRPGPHRRATPALK